MHYLVEYSGAPQRGSRHATAVSPSLSGAGDDYLDLLPNI